LKIVLGVDAIFPPLTGIGRYALELARRLPAVEDVDQVCYYSLGRWVQGVDELVGTPEAQSIRRRLAVHVRGWASRQRWLVLLVYSRLMPLLSKHRLAGMQDALFHSPNYFLPPFPGPAVSTVHDLSFIRYPETHPKARVAYIERELPRSLRRASFLITSSRATRDEVISFFNWPADRIASIPLGTNKRFTPRTAAETEKAIAGFGLRHGAYSLCVSTIEPRKKIDRLLEAYSRLPENLRARFPLVIAGGSGWLSGSIHERLTKAENAGWARYLGYVDESELPILYAGARMFCFPSIYEGFGLPVLEAMASGVPVVTSDKSSLPEVAGGAALLVDPEDIDAFTFQLDRALSDDQWRNAAIAVGLENAHNMTWESCARKTVEVYRRAARIDPGFWHG